jgi:Type II secretion system (T2SS), protein M subtype b
VNRRTPLIAGTVVIVLLLAWYVAVWRPAGTASTRAVASKAAVAVLRKQLEDGLAGLLTMQRTLPAQEAQQRLGETEVPTSPSVDTLIDQISSIASADQITWTNESQTLGTASAAAVATTTATTSTSATTTGSSTSTVPMSATPASGDTPLAFTLAVSGSYPAMTKFITDLEHRPRLIVIDTLNYAPTGRAISVTITGRAFYNTTANPILPTVAGGS